MNIDKKIELFNNLLSDIDVLNNSKKRIEYFLKKDVRFISTKKYEISIIEFDNTEKFYLNLDGRSPFSSEYIWIIVVMQSIYINGIPDDNYFYIPCDLIYSTNYEERIDKYYEQL